MGVTDGGNLAKDSNPSQLLEKTATFDAAVLRELVDGDAAMFHQFASMFVGSFETALASMESAIGTGDRSTLCAMGHRAKSTARNVGASALGDACETLERIANTADMVELTRMINTVRVLFEVVCDGFSPTL